MPVLSGLERDRPSSRSTSRADCLPLQPGCADHSRCRCRQAVDAEGQSTPKTTRPDEPPVGRRDEMLDVGRHQRSEAAARPVEDPTRRGRAGAQDDRHEHVATHGQARAAEQLRRRQLQGPAAIPRRSPPRPLFEGPRFGTRFAAVGVPAVVFACGASTEGAVRIHRRAIGRPAVGRAPSRPAHSPTHHRWRAAARIDHGARDGRQTPSII